MYTVCMFEKAAKTFKHSYDIQSIYDYICMHVCIYIYICRLINYFHRSRYVYLGGIW